MTSLIDKTDLCDLGTQAAAVSDQADGIAAQMPPDRAALYRSLAIHLRSIAVLYWRIGRATPPPKP